MSQHTLFQKGTKLDKSKLRKEKFFLGAEHGPGVYVYVRGLTAPESEDYADIIQKLRNESCSEEDRKNAGYILLAICVVDDDGVAMFADANEVRSSFDISSADFIKIMQTCNRLSGTDKVTTEKN